MGMRWIKIISVLFIGIALFFGICLFVIAKSPGTAAVFADNVLRPIVGDKAVIAIEGVVFGVQDKINQVKDSDPSRLNYTSTIKEVPVDQNKDITVPKDLIPILPPLQGEGVWKSISDTGLYTTFIRTDSERPFAVVNLVYIPMRNIAIGAVAGTKYPGGTLHKYGSGIIPQNIQQSGRLIAAFNGGFQEKDGHYGMYADGITYSPMKDGLATLFIYKDGKVALQKFDQSQMSESVLVARQNGPLLITNGANSKNISKGVDLWAGTSSGGYVTWRSGLGITASGDLVYAVGPSLIPTSLANALLMSGSVNAMQLDINTFWVRFMIYTWDGEKSSYSWSTLTKSLANGGKQYLNGNEKDFFYLYRK